MVGAIKAGLRCKIQARRQAKGEEDISGMNLFDEPKIEHKLTPEEMERKERRRLQNRMAARRCRERKKKMQMYTKEEFEQKVEECNRLKSEKADVERQRDYLQMILKSHRNCPVGIKQERDADTSDHACAMSGIAQLLPVKTEPGPDGGEERSCSHQVAPACFAGHDADLRTLLTTPTADSLTATSPYPPEPLFAPELQLPSALPYTHFQSVIYDSPPGDSPEGGLWGRGLPSASDSDYAAATPQSCVSPLESVYSPSPADLPASQGSTGFEPACPPSASSAPTASPGSPDLRGGRLSTSDASFYPSTPETCSPDLAPANPLDTAEQEHLANLGLQILKEMANVQEDVDMDDVFLAEDTFYQPQS